MQKQLIDKLNAEFPNIIRCPINVGDGWYEILRSLLIKLRRLSSDVRIVNVEQEFGGLQVYTNPRNRSVDAIVEEAEHQSWKVCEYCGKKTGVSRRTIHGRRVVLCTSCATE